MKNVTADQMRRLMPSGYTPGQADQAFNNILTEIEACARSDMDEVSYCAYEFGPDFEAQVANMIANPASYVPTWVHHVLDKLSDAGFEVKFRVTSDESCQFIIVISWK